MVLFAGLLNRAEGGCETSRRLNGVDAIASSPEEYKTLCPSDTTNFETYVAIKDSHLMIVAKANQETSSCPDLVLHSLENSEKELLGQTSNIKLTISYVLILSSSS